MMDQGLCLARPGAELGRFAAICGNENETHGGERNLPFSSVRSKNNTVSSPPPPKPTMAHQIRQTNPCLGVYCCMVKRTHRSSSERGLFVCLFVVLLPFVSGDYCTMCKYVSSCIIHRLFRLHQFIQAAKVEFHTHSCFAIGSPSSINISITPSRSYRTIFAACML